MNYSKRVFLVAALLAAACWCYFVLLPLLDKSVWQELSFVAPIVATGCLAAAACALLGTFLVLRRMSLIGDAISHAVLPGIAIAFFITNSVNSLAMVLGAAAVGLVTVALIEALYRTGRVQEDASIGVVFPALFALGVILISHFAGKVHLDTDCVLQGEITFVSQDRLVLFQSVDLGPKTVWLLGLVTLANALFVSLFWKELKLGTFDPELAAALGLAPMLIQYLLMTMVSITTVATFQSVGAILVVGLLIVPAATAYLFTDRLATMLGLSIGFGILSAITGYSVARQLDLSISGSMAASAGLFFCFGWLLSPRHGVVASLMTRLFQSLDFCGQLLIKHVSTGSGDVFREHDAMQRFGWRPIFTRLVIWQLQRKRIVELVRDGMFRVIQPEP